MTTRSLVFAIGCAVIAALCFFPPHKNVVDDGYATTAYNLEYHSHPVIDYNRLAILLLGVAAITGALCAVTGKKRVVVDATRLSREVAK